MQEPPPPRRLDLDALREIVEGTAVETGPAFFDSLVRHLARAIDTRCAWVTEYLEEERRLRALSFWVGDRYHGDFEYAIADTPCEAVVLERRLVHIPDQVLELYAHDPALEPLGAVSYLGVPLLDTDGRVLGHLGVLHDRPMPEDAGLTAIFNIFAGRAAAELRRVRRDRDLEDRERKLSRLVGSAMDAIVELDGDLRVVTMNPAAERGFNRNVEEVRGASVDVLLTETSRLRLEHLAGDLKRQPEGRQSLWIPEGLQGTRAGGPDFPAEATLSRFEMGGRAFLTLILRNIDERVEAKERIGALTREAETLRAEIEALQGFEEIVGRSAALRQVLADVERVAPDLTTVLVTGETGTGKELIARAIHQRSPRAARPLVTVNCAAIASSLQESEFFGHERGAFTGATQRRDGRFRLADGGTIFLDEVGEMSLDLQAKLLRVLQEGEFEPVGAVRTIRVDVRVIAATNRDLERMAAAGSFRSDLLYRLNVFPLHVPPLRDRGDDVLHLAEAFTRSLARRRGRPAPRLTAAHRERLKRYEWPGNVRELRNVIERALITSVDGETLNLDRALPDADAAAAAAVDAHAAAQRPPDGEAILTATAVRALERANILRALEASGWKVSGAGGAAARLGLNPNTLASRMKALRVQRPSRGN